MLRIAEVRKAKGKMQKDVAADLELSRTTYNQYETGKRAPDHETLVKIANYFHVTTDYLLGNTDISAIPDAKKETLAPKSDEELLCEYFFNKLGRHPSKEEYLRLKDYAEIFVKSVNK